MLEPEHIYIDQRVAKTLPQDRDEELAARGIAQVHYIRADVVREQLRQLRGDEQIIQIIARRPRPGAGEFNQDELVALTNLGRLFTFIEEDGGREWTLMGLPDFEAPA